MAERRYVLPFPPSVNRIWRAVGAGIVLSAPARAWLKAAHNAMPIGRVPATLPGRLEVTIILNAPARLATREWDIFNREKLLCDFMTKQRVWHDDAQIDHGHVHRGVAGGTGSVEIHIVEIG